MKTRFRGVFLTSQQAEATAGFYEKVAALPLETVGEKGGYVYWKLDRDGMQLAIHDAQAFAAHAYPALAGSNLTHLYFRIDDRQAFLAHLERRGMWPGSVDDIVVTVVDPDGRKVLFGTA